jgi:hypothetical protein
MAAQDRLLRLEGVGHVRARRDERAQLVRVGRAPFGLPGGVLLLANFGELVDEPPVEAVARERRVVVARLGLEVNVARPAAGDVREGKGVPAESVREGLLWIGRGFELIELLVEGAEVLFVVLVKVDDLSGTGARDGAAPGAGAGCGVIAGSRPRGWETARAAGGCRGCSRCLAISTTDCAVLLRCVVVDGARRSHLRP